MAAKAVLMMAYGSPGTINDIEPYLLNVRGGRATPPATVDKIKRRYAAIGGQSPLLEITQAQASALQERLNGLSPDRPWQVFVGMLHWHPYIQETVEQIRQAGLRRIVALCLTPYDSKHSTQAYFDHLDRALGGTVLPTQVTRVPAWYTHPLFIQALAESVRRALDQASAAKEAPDKIIFTAHSLPVIPGQAEDTYAEQVGRTARAVAEQLNLAPGQWELCYQSAGARDGEWLGPALDTRLDQLAGAGAKQVLVAPIGFVSDHIETLYDLDIEAAGRAQAKGLAFRRVAALNTHPTFIQALAQIILHGDQA